MDVKSSYSDCELRYIEQGFEEGMAREICASEDRSSDEDSDTSRADEEYDYWGEV